MSVLNQFNSKDKLSVITDWQTNNSKVLKEAIRVTNEEIQERIRSNDVSEGMKVYLDFYGNLNKPRFSKLNTEELDWFFDNLMDVVANYQETGRLHNFS